MKIIALLALVVGFVFSSCDTGNGTNGDEFVVSTNDTISVDDERLGLVGTSVSSSNTSVATVDIVSGKIKITSAGTGSSVISVFDNSEPVNEAKINITVSKTGTITIGIIEKYVNAELSIMGYWEWVDAQNDDFYLYLELLVNNTGIFGGTRPGTGEPVVYSEFSINIIQFEIVDNKLIVTFEGITDPMECDFELSHDGNTLTVIGLDGAEGDNRIPIPFTRKDTSGINPFFGIWSTDEGTKFDFSENNTFVTVYSNNNYGWKGIWNTENSNKLILTLTHFSTSMYHFLSGTFLNE